ncbi:hypothetical protein [Microbacterium sp. LWO13-1.2]|uniref:hypothetical protein n=1 Tax=Microbacterium sp. LWO13-1.2 TaxID=3135262 RepID=UPI003138A606
MSTSDQQGHGPLTRKQLREIRLTGSTPVITAEEAAAAAAPPVVPPVSQPVAPVEQTASVDESDEAAGRLTRRQVREQERIRTGSVPIADPAPETPAEDLISIETADAEAPEIVEAVELAETVEAVPPAEPAEAVPPAEPAEAVEAEMVTSVPLFSRIEDSATPGEESAAADAPAETDGVGTLFEDTSRESTEDDEIAPAAVDDTNVRAEERPTVSPAFGRGLLGDDADHKPFAPSFDELLTVNDSTGSQHIAPSALIFTQSPGEGSLSGPVASTGEVLVTGSYELPQGLGSQGHAHGTTDGKDVDAVLIDGELAPASSPTPIAASAAISTMKSAGEVIRPPAPEKGNKLMLTLAITAGGLALALAVALIVAFTTNVF